MTVLNTQAVDYLKDWAIHEQESCSDHKIIKYEIGKGMNLHQQTGLNKVGKKYRVTQKGTEKFQKTRTNNGATNIRNIHSESRNRGIR